MTEATFAFDLHVLSTPPAFNLSQNQTLQFKILLLFSAFAEIRISFFFLPFAIHLSMNKNMVFKDLSFIHAEEQASRLLLLCQFFFENFFIL